MRPRVAARLLAALAAVALVAVVAALVVVSAGYLASTAASARPLRWCRHMEVRWVPWWLGQSALVALGALAVSTARTTMRHRRARASAGCEPVLVMAVDVPLAYSVAGRPGQIVVSAGMLRRLDCHQRCALFAHERSHLRHGHHRYLWLADIAAAVPSLRPLRTAIRFALERWADEDAALVVGSRELVALALARAALAQADARPAAVLAAATSGVPRRVEALLAGGRPALRARGAVMAGALTLSVGLAVTVVNIC